MEFFGKSPNYNYIEESITGITTQTDDPSQVFKGNLFISGSGVTNIFAGLYPNSSLELIEGLSLNLNKNRYDEQDPGNLFNYNNSVYNPDELLVDDLQVQQQQSTAEWTQEQIEAKVFK